MTRPLFFFAAALLLLVTIMAIVFLAAVPPVSRDALSHHLFVPRLYLEKGTIYEIPGIRFSYFPMNLELLYLLALKWGNDIACKYIHFAFALMTAALIYGYIQKRLGRRYALLGGLFFLTIPMVVKLSVTAYVDLGLIFFSLAALLALFKWREAGFRYRYLLIAGVSCGLALGTKYNGLITFLLLSAMVPFLYLGLAPRPHGHQLRALWFAICFAAVSLTVFAPWMVRNYRWTKNPLYPLGQMVLTDDQSTGQGGAVAMKPWVLRRTIYREKWWQTAMIPLRIFFEGQDDQPRHFDGRLSPLLLLLPLGLLIRFRRKPAEARLQLLSLLAFAVLFLLCAFFTVDMRIRYIAPIIAPLVILSVFGLETIITATRPHFSSWPGGMIKVGLVLVVAFWAYSGATYFLGQFNQIKPFEYLSGRITRQDYIQRHRPEYAALRFANEKLEGPVRLLGLFMGDRGYYSHHDIFFDTSLFWRAVKNSTTSAGMAAILQDRQVSHLLIYRPIFLRWCAFNFNVTEKQRLQDFLQHRLQLLFAKNEYFLYRIKDPVKK